MAMMGGGGLGQLQDLYIYDVEGNKFHYLSQNEISITITNHIIPQRYQMYLF